MAKFVGIVASIAGDGHGVSHRTVHNYVEDAIYNEFRRTRQRESEDSSVIVLESIAKLKMKSVPIPVATPEMNRKTSQLRKLFQAPPKLYIPMDVCAESIFMIEERIIELESKLAFQEDYIQSLNQVVISLQQKIDRLEAGFRSIDEKLTAALAEESGSNPVNERPPHY